MSFFGALIRTTVNVVKLPVELPVAVVKDVVLLMDDRHAVGESTKAVVRELKDESES